MQELTDQHIENDKSHAPFLLAASFQGLIRYIGNYSKGGTVFFIFSPKDKAEVLIDQFRTKTDPQIPAQDLFSAIEVFWEQVYKTRNEEIEHGEPREK